MAVSFEVVYTVEDESGGTSQFSLFFPVTFTLTDYLEAARGYAAFFDAVLTGKFHGLAELCFGVDISGLTNNLAGVTGDVEEIGSFVFRSDQDFPVKVNVPAIDDSKVLPGTHQLDTSDAAVAGFITLMETGSGGVAPCDISEFQITTLESATEKFRNSGSAT